MEKFYNVIDGKLYDQIPKATKHPERYYKTAYTKNKDLREYAVDYFTKTIHKELKSIIKKIITLKVTFYITIDFNAIEIKPYRNSGYVIRNLPYLLKGSYHSKIKCKIIKDCLKEYLKECKNLFLVPSEKLYEDITLIRLENIDYSFIEEDSIIIKEKEVAHELDFGDSEHLINFILSDNTAAKIKLRAGDLAKYITYEKKFLEREIAYEEKTLKRLKDRLTNLTANYDKLDDYEKLCGEIAE